MTELARRIGGYETVVDDRFDGGDLDRSVWLPYYLPQWAGRAASRARYRIADGCLQLHIADDQAPWLRDVTGEMRVSSLQTGCFAGPVGSTVGQHRTDDALVVVEEQPTVRLATPMFGSIELRARWRPVAGQMVALWMIGFEDAPERSGEICVCEIFGADASSGSAAIGMGVHPFGDPAITDDFEQVEVGIDVGDWHDYGVVWTPEDVTFFVDGEPVKHVAQSPQYPMQLMLNIYDFAPSRSDRAASPFEVAHVRILRPADVARG